MGSFLTKTATKTVVGANQRGSDQSRHRDDQQNAGAQDAANKVPLGAIVTQTHQRQDRN